MKSRLNRRKWIVSAQSGLLLARVSVISEGLLDGRRTDGTLTGESKSVAKTDWEVDGEMVERQDSRGSEAENTQKKYQITVNRVLLTALASVAARRCRGRGLIKSSKRLIRCWTISTTKQMGAGLEDDGIKEDASKQRNDDGCCTPSSFQSRAEEADLNAPKQDSSVRMRQINGRRNK